MPVKQFRSAGPMTLNNYTDDEVAHLRTVVTMDQSKIKYICWIKEVGENQTPHLQIFAQSFNVLSVKAWHSILGPRIANIVPTVDSAKAIQYCKGYKDGQPKIGSDLTSVEEYGIPPEMGKRNDIHNTASELKKRPIEELYFDSTHNSVIAQHYNFFKDVDSHCKSQRMYEAAKDQFNQYFEERDRQPWEKHLDMVIDDEIDPRHIYWYVDTIGEAGKTVNGKNLMFNHDAYYCTGGKANDIYYAYNGQPIVVVNLAASVSQEVQDYLYKILEEFKDGVFSSGKYASKTKTFVIPHVIVFSNHLPDFTKMKKCRIKCYNIADLNEGEEKELGHDFEAPNPNYEIFNKKK